MKFFWIGGIVIPALSICFFIVIPWQRVGHVGLFLYMLAYMFIGLLGYFVLMRWLPERVAMILGTISWVAAFVAALWYGWNMEKFI